MATKNKDSKNKEKNYKSRYDRNRHCFRKDETTYVYQEWIPTGEDTGYYIDHEYHVGEEGITIELLDVMQEFDNSEAQDSEDSERNDEQFNYENGEAADEGDFHTSPFDNLSTSYVGVKGMHNLAAPFTGSPEYIGPEAVLFPDAEEPSKAQTDFDTYVRPKLSEDQQNLIYDRYCMNKGIEQIAAEAPVKADGSHISHQAVSNRLTKIKTKVLKNMPQE